MAAFFCAICSHPFGPRACRTKLRSTRNYGPSIFPLYSIKPNLRNLFMKKLTRDKPAQYRFEAKSGRPRLTGQPRPLVQQSNYLIPGSAARSVEGFAQGRPDRAGERQQGNRRLSDVRPRADLRA